MFDTSLAVVGASSLTADVNEDSGYSVMNLLLSLVLCLI